VWCGTGDTREGETLGKRCGCVENRGGGGVCGKKHKGGRTREESGVGCGNGGPNEGTAGGGGGGWAGNVFGDLVVWVVACGGYGVRW